MIHRAGLVLVLTSFVVTILTSTKSVAEGLLLKDADSVTVGMTGTHGTLDGHNVSRTLSFYTADDTSYFAVDVYENAKFTFERGGIIDKKITNEGGIRASGTSTVMIKGGTINGVSDAYGSSSITICGEANTAIVNGLCSADDSKITVAGGLITDRVWASNNSSIDITGGTIHAIPSAVVSYDRSTVNVSGGTLVKGIQASDSSTVNINGGTIKSNLWVIDAGDKSTVNIGGGMLFGCVYAEQRATIIMKGGIIIASTWGNYACALAAEGGGTINLLGTGFKYTPHGGKTTSIISGTLPQGIGIIEGTLRNGNKIKESYQNSATIEVNIDVDANKQD